MSVALAFVGLIVPLLLLGAVIGAQVEEAMNRLFIRRYDYCPACDRLSEEVAP